MIFNQSYYYRHWFVIIVCESGTWIYLQIYWYWCKCLLLCSFMVLFRYGWRSLMVYLLCFCRNRLAIGLHDAESLIYEFFHPWNWKKEFSFFFDAWTESVRNGINNSIYNFFFRYNKKCCRGKIFLIDSF